MKRAMTLVAPCVSITGMVAGVVCFQRGSGWPAITSKRAFRLLGIVTFSLGNGNALPIHLLTVYNWTGLFFRRFCCHLPCGPN